jgi:hypothetical protein
MKKAVFCFLLVAAMVASAYPEKPAQFKGTVIYMVGDSIEIKKGKKEITLNLTPDTKILFHGEKADRTAVEMCQKVKALYVVKDGRKELVQLEIVSDSYCVQ